MMSSIANIRIKFKEGCSDIQPPSKGTEASAGYDIRACVDGDVTLAPGTITIIPTGMYIEMPNNYECQVRSRSGLASKGIAVFNSPGTIDADYRGEVGIIIINASSEPFVVTRGMRIAQLVFSKLDPVHITIVDSDLSSTTRLGGFGSTGTQ